MFEVPHLTLTQSTLLEEGVLTVLCKGVKLDTDRDFRIEASIQLRGPRQFMRVRAEVHYEISAEDCFEVSETYSRTYPRETSLETLVGMASTIGQSMLYYAAKKICNQE